MGIIVKLVDQEPMVINGDAITYAEGGNVLEILNEDEEILAVYRNWQYAIVQESEEEYRHSLLADLDEEDDLDDEDGEDFDDEELDDPDGDDLEEVTGPPSTDEEEAVQRAREVMNRAIAEMGGLPPVTLTLEELFDENAARPDPQS